MLQKISDFIKSELQSMLKNRQQSQKNSGDAKISDFQTTPPLVRVCPNFQNPSPDVRVRIFKFLHIFQFLHIFIFAH